MSDLTHHAAEAVATTAGKVTGASGVGLVLFGSVTAQDIGIFAGIVIGLGGWITQTVMTWYFKSQSLKLERLRHELSITQKELVEERKSGE